jgi:hypothetical protein
MPLEHGSWSLRLKQRNIDVPLLRLTTWQGDDTSPWCGDATVGERRRRQCPGSEFY